MESRKPSITVGTDPAPIRTLSTAERAIMAVLFLFGLVTQLNTVLNNTYHRGSSLYDSTIFQTIVWRSGWALHQESASLLFMATFSRGWRAA
jgi:hypothetical protein